MARGNIEKSGTPIYTGASVLVDDTVALVDDPTALTGSTFERDETPKASINIDKVKGK